MNTVSALASVVLKELYRRKDFYVLLFLTFVITLLLGTVNFFNVPHIARDLKEICLLLIWISALVIALTTAARQIPAERENRTIFPLLAKPVTRGQIIAGKFVGCWLAVGIALIVFYFFFTVISCSREGRWPLGNYFQMFWLQWTMLSIVIAMALLGSVLFTSPAENVTICFFVVMGIQLLGRNLNDVALQQAEPFRTIVYTIYFLIPHLELFDIRDFIIYDHAPIPWVDCLLVTVYGLAYVVLFLYVTWLVFRRKALTA